MATITYNSELQIMSCWCGIKFAVPTNLHRRYTDRDQDSLYCPLGHSCVPGVNKVKDLEGQLSRANARATAQFDRAEAISRSRAAVKGQVTKIKRRIFNGVCPCCNRTFQNLQRHMDSKHPKFIKKSEKD